MYATLSQLKTYLAVTSNTDDALLTDLLTRATAAIDTATRKTFSAPAATTRSFGRDVMMWDGLVKRDYCMLPSGVYIAQLVSAADGDGNPIPLADIEKLPATEPYSVLVRKNKRWCGASQFAEINARWGYSINPPDDIIHATIRLAALMYRQRGTANDPDRPVVADHGLVLLPSAMPDDVRQTLLHYRDIV